MMYFWIVIKDISYIYINEYAGFNEICHRKSNLVGSEPVSLPGACGSTEHKRDCEISVNKSLDG